MGGVKELDTAPRLSLAANFYQEQLAIALVMKKALVAQRHFPH